VPAQTVHLDRVVAGYDGRPVVGELSLTVDRGGVALLVGPNGGGKSTLLRVLAGLLPPLSGSVAVLGTTPRRARRRTALVAQQPEVDRGMPVTVAELVASGRLRATLRPQRLRRADRQRVADAVGAVGLAGLAGHRVSALSGGQLQRALLARALTADAELLLLDEPLAALDAAASESFVGLLAELAGDVTVVVASHDRERFAALAPAVVAVNGMQPSR
jgi:zinc transport system ATP-binding protein